MDLVERWSQLNECWGFFHFVLAHPTLVMQLFQSNSWILQQCKFPPWVKERRSPIFGHKALAALQSAEDLHSTEWLWTAKLCPNIQSSKAHCFLLFSRASLSYLSFYNCICIYEKIGTGIACGRRLVVVSYMTCLVQSCFYHSGPQMLCKLDIRQNFWCGELCNEVWKTAAEWRVLNCGERWQSAHQCLQ